MSAHRVMLRRDDTNNAGFVFVSVPPPKGEKYAFSVPVSSLYSILVYPVGSIFNSCASFHAEAAAESEPLVRFSDFQVSFGRPSCPPTRR